jgi:hypothetical protein
MNALDAAQPERLEAAAAHYGCPTVNGRRPAGCARDAPFDENLRCWLATAGHAHTRRIIPGVRVTKA